MTKCPLCETEMRKESKEIAEAVNADADKMVRDARIINPRIDVLKMSLKTGEGFDKWIGFLKKSITAYS